MFETLNPKIADRISDCLQTTGPEGRALKVLRQYRKDPNEDAMHEAVALLNALDQNKQIELRQAARI